MAYKFGEAIFDLATVVTDVMESAATSDGAAGKTTLVDNALPISTPEDDHYNKGTIFFLDCTNATLDGTTAIVTDFGTVTGTSTYTFAAAAAQTKSGDLYGVINREFPRYALRRAVNLALKDIGDVDQQDTSLTTVADQSYYTIPSGVANVKKVEVARNTADPYDYYPIFHTNEIEGQIQIHPDHQPILTGYKIRLTYNTAPTALAADTDTLPTLLNRMWLLWTAKAHCLRWRLNRIKEDDPNLKQILNEAINEADKKSKIFQPMLKTIPQSPAHSVWAVKDGYL